MKKIFLIMVTVQTLMLCCGHPKGPGEEAGEEANSARQNENDYDTNKDTTIDMSSGGGVGTDIYKADTLANKGKESGGTGH